MKIITQIIFKLDNKPKKNCLYYVKKKKKIKTRYC